MMRKFLSVLSFAFVVGVTGAASAADHTGQLGIGYQESLTAGINTVSGNSAGAWSVNYGIASNMTAQAVVGLDIVNKGGNNRANFGARLLYDLVENENSDFYTGLGLVYDIDKGAKTLRINVPLGFEWSFAGLPEIGLSAEAGLVWDYGTQGAKQSRLSTVGGVGAGFQFGAHYYF
jgi:hypothetical protein